MKYTNISLGIGIFLALGICIFSVAKDLRSSPQADQWAMLFLLWPGFAAFIACVITEICAYVLFKKGMRSLNAEGFDFAYEFEKIERDGTSYQRVVLHVFTFSQITMALSGGILIFSIFLAPYLLL